MTRTDALLIALMALVIIGMWRAEVRHKELMELLNDFATMVGEFFPILKERKDHD